MRINPNAIIPSTEVLKDCRAGLTRHIRKSQNVLRETRDTDLRKYFRDKVRKLKIIREEIQFLIDNL